MSAVTTSGAGTLFLDSKLDEAIDILALKETFRRHVEKGGVVMYPILTLALAALLISLFKIFELLSVKKASPKDLEIILDHLRSGRNEDALAHARHVQGPSGRMLTAALENIDADEDLVEEILSRADAGNSTQAGAFLTFYCRYCRYRAPSWGCSER